MIAARTVGAAERALQLARDWAVERRQFGRPSPTSSWSRGCSPTAPSTSPSTGPTPTRSPGRPTRRTTARPLHAKASTAKLAGVGGRRPGRRPVPADLRRPRLRPHQPGRAHVPGAARRPDLGGHLRDPAPDHRQRADQARHRALALPTSSRHLDRPYDHKDRRWTSVSPPPGRAQGGRARLHRVHREVRARLRGEQRPAPEAHGTSATPSSTRPAGRQHAGRVGRRRTHVPEQVTVQEELGGSPAPCGTWCGVRRTRCASARPSSASATSFPVIRGERRDCYAVTEPDAGSDPQNLTTTATRTDDGWVLNGEKWFVTVGDHADFMIVLAAAGDGARADPLPRRQGHPGHRDDPGPALDAHLRLRAPRVHLHRRAGAARTPCSAASARATTSPAPGSPRNA